MSVTQARQSSHGCHTVSRVGRAVLPTFRVRAWSLCPRPHRLHGRVSGLREALAIHVPHHPERHPACIRTPGRGSPRRAVAGTRFVAPVGLRRSRRAAPCGSCLERRVRCGRSCGHVLGRYRHTTHHRRHDPPPVPPRGCAAHRAWRRSLFVLPSTPSSWYRHWRASLAIASGVVHQDMAPDADFERLSLTSWEENAPACRAVRYASAAPAAAPSLPALHASQPANGPGAMPGVPSLR